jgi:hypothetical protein
MELRGFYKDAKGINDRLPDLAKLITIFMVDIV